MPLSSPRTKPAPRFGDPEPQSTFALTGQIARGDEEAFGTFYDAWFDKALNMTRSITRRDEAFCLDVVQDCMLKVAKRMKPLASDAAVTQWMGRALATTAIDALRADARRRRRERDSAPGEATSTTPISDAEEAEQRAWLTARLADLPQEERDLLLRRFDSDATLEEIGKVFGMTGSAAHGRIRRAVERLKQRAKDWMQ